MSVPKANQNARRWTPETTIALLEVIDHYSRRKDVQFLGEALDYASVHKNIWSYWRTTWKENADIVHRMQMIEQRFENKIISGAMNNRLHASTAQLILKTNYGYNSAKSNTQLDPGFSIVYEPENILENLKILPAPETLPLAEHGEQIDMNTISLVQKHAVENIEYEQQKKVS